MSCGVGHKLGLDLAWLWLWPVATALIQPLDWEHPATDVALKRQKKKEKKRCKSSKQDIIFFVIELQECRSN